MGYLALKSWVSGHCGTTFKHWPYSRKEARKKMADWLHVPWHCIYTSSFRAVFMVFTVELQWLEHWWLVYHGSFELVIQSLGKKSHSCRFGIISGVYLFSYWKMVYGVYSLESPRWGDSNVNTQYTFILKKVGKISLFCLLIWRYYQPSLARTTPVSN